LGPLVSETIRYHYSDSLLNQEIGLDAVALLGAAPVAEVAGLLVLRGHRAAPVLTFIPATFAAYMVPQYVVGPDYLGLPNPLHGSFICSTWPLDICMRYCVYVRERNNIMKKAFGLLLVVGLLVAAMATAALAAVPGDGVRDLVDAGSQAGNGYAWGFVDADENGINDSFVDVDGNGVCDNFADLDGDGINDFRGTLGMGSHGPNGIGDCAGDNFIDIDGDGECDNAGSGGGQQRMGSNGPGRTR
jgi:hypothetical protein